MKDEVYRLHAEGEETHWWFAARRHVLAPLIAEAMCGRERDLIVDVGCGTGGTVAALCGDFNCIGIDYSRQAIDIARAKYPGCTFICGDVTSDLREHAHRIGLVLLMDVLEHIENDRAFLSDLVELARPGAHLLITVPAEPALWSDHDAAAGHVRRYDSCGFSELWRGLPVSARLVTPFNSRLYPAIWIARVLGKRIGLFTGKGGGDLAMPHPAVNRVLHAIFAGEQARIARMVADRSQGPFRRGVSLLALLRREEITA